MPLFETTLLGLVLWAAFGYLMGSIPYGMVIARVMGLGNLRDIGSGNIGATNVLRTGNKGAAALTLILDAAKGIFAVLIARMLGGEDSAQVAALFAMLGHCFPVWLGFKGGKGVATFLGVVGALSWPVGLACCAVWAVAFGVTRMSSMGALAAASSSTFLMLGLGSGQMFVLGFMLTFLIFWRHRENIARIKAGTEPKVGRQG
jgi:glycerol-3-phosphate acyltransferase PlsY